MLQFVYGKPATGKTFYLFEKLKECVNDGKQVVFIVPEQFTFETEKAVLESLGDNLSSNVTVLSFSRLYDELGRIVGGISARLLNDSDRVIFMKMALNKSADDLKLWSKYTKSVNFAKTILESVCEFKMNAVTPDELKQCAENARTDYLKNKLYDFSLIFDNYNLLISEKFLDPDDKLQKVCDFLKKTDYFSGKTVFFDSFKGFTGQQFKIIDLILQKAGDVYFAMTDNSLAKGDYCLFANIRKAALKIKSSAEKYGISVCEPICLTKTHYNSDIINRIEELLSIGKTDVPESTEGLTLCQAETPFDEAEFVARNMRRLVRENGYRYSDFVIVSRDTEKYKTAINSACRKNKINCFSDDKISLSNFPISVAVRSLISSLTLSSDDIINFHKSGVGILTDDEIYTLENYIHIWNISGDMWEKQWDMDPRGLVADNDISEDIKSEIEKINSIREKAVKPVLEFKNSFSGNASDMAIAVFNALKNCNFAEKMLDFRNRFKEINNDYYADAIKQSYEQYMSILDSIVRCFGNAKITKAEFSEALNLAVSLCTIGVIPQTLDEVMFGSADRIRPSRPKVAFIMGANFGEFPKTVSNSGIFTLNERNSLVENGIEIPNSIIDLSVDEEFLVYSNLCCPTDEIFISYSEMSVSGEKSEPSNFVSRIKKEIGCDIKRFPETDKLTVLPETDETAFSEYCRVLQYNSETANAIESALSDTEYSPLIETVKTGKVLKTDTLSEKTAGELYGNRIRMSASALDTFSRCHFSFFCKYGLKAKTVDPADFNTLQRGTIVHYCLERLITEHKENIGELSEKALEELTDMYLDEYLNSVKGFSSVSDERLMFIRSRISRSLKDIVIYIASEIAQSDFKPVACELKIGNKDGIKKVAFPYDKGELILNGSIDRVDEYNGYVRIIDYKTGSRDFKLPDILFGLNMQMLLYLYGVIKGRKEQDTKAAGILYMPSRRDINGKGHTMSGLILADEDIAKSMDKDGNGEFIPKLVKNKDGSLSKKNESYITADEFMKIFDHIEAVMRKTGDLIASGDISVSPINGRESDACKYCDFKKICGIEDTEIKKVERLSKEKVMEKLSQGGETPNGNI